MLHRLPVLTALALCVCLIAVTPARADVGVVPPDLLNPASREIHGSPRMDRISEPPGPVVVHHTDSFDWDTAALAGTGFAIAIGAGWIVAVTISRRKRAHALR
jgi:hypothetical protein